MPKYVIVRSDGKYVSRPGSDHSYTHLLQEARIYPSLDAARSDLCPSNEHILTL